MKKRMISAILSAFMLLGLVGCGSQGADYSELEKLLDNGQYDAAITWIQNYQANSEETADEETLAVSEDDVFAMFVGNYEHLRCYDEELQNMSINADATITLNDKTYPATISATDNEEYYTLEYDEGNGASTCITIHLYEDGTAYYDGFYLPSEELRQKMDETYQFLAGSYLEENTVSGTPVFTISEDGYYTQNGSSQKLFLNPEYYDSADYGFEDSDGKFWKFSYMLEDGTYLDSYSSNEKVACLWSPGNHNDVCYKCDNLEYVELTAENIWDYFEFGDYELYNVYEDAFNEPSTACYMKQLRLKADYAERYFPKGSKVAIEFTVDIQNYNNSTLTFDLAAETVEVVLGNAVWSADSQKSTLSNLRDNNFYYPAALEGGEQGPVGYSLYVIEERENLGDAVKEGDTYTVKSDYVTDFVPDSFQVTRSETTLAFVKE